jgi:hypothetical protein
MPRVHEAIGFAIVTGFGVLFLWGLTSLIVRREPNRWFWRLLAVLQVTLIVQLVAGTILLILGDRRVLLHYFYGSLFPAVVLVIAHVLARGMDDEKDTWKVFAVAAFFLFGLTLRALTTGLGMA